MSKIEKLEEKLQNCLQVRNYYEAHQIYRTLYYRLLKLKQWDKLQIMLFDGIMKFLKEDEQAIGLDLAGLYIDVLEKCQAPVSSTIADRIEQLFKHTKPTLNDGSKDTVNRVDIRNNFVSSAIRWSINNSKKNRNEERGHPLIHRIFGCKLWDEGNYSAARNHLMLCSDADILAHFLIESQQKYGFDSEKDLFVAQAVLQLLCNRRLRYATILLKQYCLEHPKISQLPTYELPLLNFTWFLLLSITAKKLEFFSVLVELYRECILRDPEYIHYLDMIGQIYFGIPPPKKTGGGAGILGNLLKDLMGVDNATNVRMKYNEESDDEFYDCNSDFASVHSSSEVDNKSSTDNGAIGFTDSMDLD